MEDFTQNQCFLITLFGMRTNSLYIGYAFDYSFSTIQRFNFGTHELSVSYKFGDNAMAKVVLYLEGMGSMNVLWQYTRTKAMAVSGNCW